MVSIGFLSAKGSPGCTTTVLALSAVWPEVFPGRRVLVAECDVAGGDIASGYLSGNLNSARGVLALGLSRGLEPLDALWEQLFALDERGDRLLLPGIVEHRQATNAEAAWDLLLAAMPDLASQSAPLDVLADLGRVNTNGEPRELWAGLDRLVLVTRSSLAAVATAQAVAVELCEGDFDERLRCLVVDEGRPYSATEIADALQLPLVGTLPLDPRGAKALSQMTGTASNRSRSALLRACRRLATSLIEDAPSGDQPVAGAARV
jgi:hypothetical protein